MNTVPNDKNLWSPADVQVCSNQARELFTDTLRFLTERHCPNISMALTATAILTLATVIDLHRVQHSKGKSHE